MTQMLSQWLTFFKDYASISFVAAAVLLAVEILTPQSRNSVVSRLRGGMFLALYIAITTAGLILFWNLWALLGVKPLFHIDLRAISASTNPILATVGGIVSSLLLLLVSDFFYYWFHRMQHTSKFFWRFHSEHHAVEEMSALNHNHHFTEELFRIPFITIPMTLLFSFEQGYVPWLWAMLMAGQTTYIHSSTKLHLGWLRYIIPDNRFHRIHHSKEQQHFDKNFGASSALWDYLFGTIHYPQKDEWPDTGVSGQPEAVTLKQYLFRPFRGLKPRRVVDRTERV